MCECAWRTKRSKLTTQVNGRSQICCDFVNVLFVNGLDRSFSFLHIRAALRKESRPF